MKKLFLILALMFTGVTINAQDKDTTSSVVKTVINSASDALAKADTSNLGERIYNDFKDGIKNAAAALGVGITHVYDVLVKQQYVNSIIDICLYILGIFFIIFCWRKASSNYTLHLLECGWKADNTGRSRGSIDIDDTAKGIASILFGVACGIIFIALIVCMICSINEVITGFVNPEYGAMKDIANFAK